VGDHQRAVRQRFPRAAARPGRTSAARMPCASGAATSLCRLSPQNSTWSAGHLAAASRSWYIRDCGFLVPSGYDSRAPQNKPSIPAAASRKPAAFPGMSVTYEDQSQAAVMLVFPGTRGVRAQELVRAPAQAGQVAGREVVFTHERSSSR